jgi:signal transduction histidine kinase/ligand-binding sensor domain-containing protein/DNA-binding NarL/FixJ family response regulator
MKRFVLMLFILFGYKNFSFGQELQFRHLSIDKGLSQNMVTTICHDHKGYMWFGTKDGLNRYDGYTFKIYKADTYDSATLRDNYITAIYEDDLKNLWIGTMYGGLQVYRRDRDDFIKINEKNFPKEAKYISSITGNKNNNLAISFQSGHIVMMDAVTDKKIDTTTVFPGNFLILPKKEELQIPQKAILAPDNLLWISGKLGFKTYDLTKKVRVKPYQSYPTYVQEYSNNKPAGRYRDDSSSPFLTPVLDLQWDDDGVFWMNSDRGLYEFNPERKEIVLYRFTQNVYSFLPIRQKGGGKMILVSSYSDKFLQFTPATGAVKPLDLNASYQREMADASFNVMKGSRDGSIWLGSTGRGIFFSHPYLSLFEKGPMGYSEDKKKVSTSLFTVLQRKSARGGHEQILYSSLNSFGQLDILPGGQVRAYTSFDLRTRNIHEDRLGNIWLGSPMGLVKYNPDDHSEKLMVSLENSMIMSIHTDTSRIVWFSTFSTLYSFDPLTNHLEKFPFLPESDDKMLALHYSTIKPDQDGSLWIGTANGLFHFSPDKRTYTDIYYSNAKNQQSLSANEVKSIHPDRRHPDKYLWIGTPTGLNRFNKSTGTFDHFTTKDGLSNNTVYGILDDADGNLWLSTNRGISFFNVQTGTFMNFDVDNGLQSNEFNTGSYFKNRDGELFFGGINGYNRFYPKNITVRHQAIPVVISKAELVGESKDRVPNFSEISNNLLRYDQNNISLTLASLDYMASEKITYAYRISNNDTSWINIGRNRNILLTNLSPGKYVFQGRGTDGLGRWNDQLVEMTFVISPPWWRSPLAYLGYAAILLGALYVLWKRYQKRLVLHQKLEEERRQAQSILDLDKIKSKFLANITHEFRTPLTLINGHLEQLKEDSAEITLESRCTEMKLHSDQLLELINQLMDLSKVDSGAFKLRYKTKDLVQEVKTLIFNFSSHARQKDIQLQFESSPPSGKSLPVQKVTYDEVVVKTILNNLLSNACKFTPRHGFIQVALGYDPDIGEITFVVSNSGEGIPKGELSRIFDRFYQAENAIEGHLGGSGIGLSLVKELTLVHGGSVKAESEPGQGSHFTVTLKAGTAATDTPISDLSAWASGTVKISNNPSSTEADEEFPTILIAEDHQKLRQFIRESLGNRYRYIEAANGVEALEKATGQVPDLIISDVMMPKMDGQELCEKIKTSDATSHIPFILLTARTDQEDKIAGLQNGADEYLTKPFSVNELRIRVKNMLHNRKLLQERYQTSFPNVFQAQYQENTYLQKVEKVILANTSDHLFGVEKLAALMSLSTAQMNRKIKAVTGQPSVVFIQNIRMQVALQLLNQGEKNIAQIAYEVGFENPGYFSKVFKKHFGFTPSEKEKLKDYLQTNFSGNGLNSCP